MIESSLKTSFLIREAQKWIGIKEVGGDNKGQLIEMWQRSVDQKAQGESWCMAFALSQIIWIDRLFFETTGDTSFTRIFKSEHCMTVWHKTPKDLRSDVPVPGSIAIWNHKGTSLGHTGIVTEILPSQRKFNCVEGNTGPGDGLIRDGDGVFEKSRTMDGNGTMQLLGFLIPWR